MNKLGRVIHTECGHKAVDDGAKNPFEHVAERINLTPRTFWDKCHNGTWWAADLRDIIYFLNDNPTKDTTRSERVWQAINEEFHLHPQKEK